MEDHARVDRIKARSQTSRGGSSREEHRLYYGIVSCHAGGTPIMSQRLDVYQKHTRIPHRGGICLPSPPPPRMFTMLHLYSR